MTEPTPAPDAGPSDDPRFDLSRRLAELSRFLAITRTGFGAHRSALASFFAFDEQSRHAHALVDYLELVERSTDQVAREVARVSKELADAAFAAALAVSPKLPIAGDGAKS